MTVQVTLELEADESGLVTGVKVARSEFKKLEDDVQGTGTQARRTSREMRSLGNETERTGKRAQTLGQQLFSVRSALAGLGLGLATREVVRAGLAFDGYNNSLLAVVGSQAQASNEIAFVREEADRLGLNVRALTDDYVKLTAASVGTTLQGRETRELFTATAEAARVLNLSTANTSGILNAFTQVMSKGTVQAEELRGQIGDRLPGAFRLAADALGVTQEKLNDMLANGEVLAEDLLPKLARRIRSEFGEGLAAAVDSPAASFERLHNAIFELQVFVANSGLLQGLADGADLLTNAISNAEGKIISVRSVVVQTVASIEIGIETLRAMFTVVITAIDVLTDTALNNIRRTVAEQARLIASVYDKLPDFILDNTLAGTGRDFFLELAASVEAGIRPAADLQDEIDGINAGLIESRDRIRENADGLSEYYQAQADGSAAAARFNRDLAATRDGFNGLPPSIKKAKDELTFYEETLEKLTSTLTDSTEVAFLNIELAIEEATIALGAESVVVQQLIALYERLNGVKEDATRNGREPDANGLSPATEGFLGVGSQLAADLSAGENGFRALGQAAQSAASIIQNEFADNQDLKDVDNFLNAVGIGLVAGQSGGSAGLNAISAGLSTFASTGHPAFAAAAAVVAALTTPSSNRPGVTIRNGTAQSQFNSGSGGRGLDSLGRTSALGSFTLDRENDVALTELANTIVQFDNAIAQILGDELSGAAADALAATSSTFQGNDLNSRQILEDRFNTILSVVDAGIRRAVEQFGGSLEDQISTLGAALEIEASIGRGDDLFKGSLALGDALDFLQNMAEPGERLADVYTRLVQSTETFTLALELFGAVGDRTAEQLVTAGDAIAQSLGGVERANSLFDSIFNNLFSDEERINANLNQARAGADTRLGAAGLSADTTADQFREIFTAALLEGNPETIAQLAEAGAALAEVVALEQDLADLRESSLADQVQAAEALAQVTEEINGRLASNTLTGFQQSVRNLSLDLADLTQRTIDAGGSTRDLVQIQIAAALEFQRLRDELRLNTLDIAAQLFGTPLEEIEARIAEIQQGTTLGLDSVTDELDRTFDQWERGLVRIQGFLDDLLLDDSLSPLTPQQRLDEALRQFRATVSAANAGDLDALGNAPGAGRALLEEALAFFPRAGGDFQAIFNEVRESLAGIGNPVSLGGGPGGGGGINAEELANLLAERDRIRFEAEARDRASLAGQLVNNLRDLAGATGQSVVDLAAELGVELRGITEALGIDLQSLTLDTTLQLANLANRLGIELTELADGLNISLGTLTNANSLLNDALEARIDALPPDLRDQLRPLLTAIETATSEASANAAIAQLEDATAALPPEFAAALAPFLANVDVVTAADDQISELRSLNSTQDLALQNLEAIGSALGARVVRREDKNPNLDGHKPLTQGFSSTFQETQSGILDALITIREDDSSAREFTQRQMLELLEQINEALRRNGNGLDPLKRTFTKELV